MMKKNVFVLLFVIITIIIGIATPAFAERLKYTGLARSEGGAVLASATVAVYLAGTTTPADVYEASSGGTSVNEVTTDSNGRWTFYADTTDYAFTQEYKVVVTKDGYSPITLDNIFILRLPTNAVGVLTNDGSGNYTWSASSFSESGDYIGLGLNNTWTGSNTFTGAVDLQSTFTFGSSTGVVYNTGGTVSTETSLSSTVLGGFTASTPLASDGSGNATTLSSQNVITTGYIDGLINMTVSSSTPVTVSGSTGYYINGQDGVITFNLPAAAAKKAYCFANALYARAITIHPASGDYIILAGENNDSSDVVSAGASTDKICVLAIDSTYWLVTSSTGTWGND